MRIIRVFPRKTNATPVDDLVRIGTEPGLFDEADEVHVSVTFTWDLPLAERLAKAWSCVAPVRIGGPATGESGGEFVPGRYVRQGYVLTSRGCPNSCWFCSVWRRDGQEVRELQIHNGWNVLDDNLLACSRRHIQRVFLMLHQNKKHGPVQFSGGLEAKRLEPWHVTELRELKPKQMFFAYDTPDDLEPRNVLAGCCLMPDSPRQATHYALMSSAAGRRIRLGKRRLGCNKRLMQGFCRWRCFTETIQGGAIQFGRNGAGSGRGRQLPPPKQKNYNGPGNHRR